MTDIAMGALAALVSAAYVSRLEMMCPQTARAVAILLHLAGLGVALWVMAWALAGREPGAAGWVAVALTGAWIATTRAQWRHGVPSWARRRSC